MHGQKSANWTSKDFKYRSQLSDKKYNYIKLHEKKLANEKERKRDYIMAKNI